MSGDLIFIYNSDETGVYISRPFHIGLWEISMEFHISTF